MFIFFKAIYSMITFCFIYLATPRTGGKRDETSGTDTHNRLTTANVSSGNLVSLYEFSLSKVKLGNLIIVMAFLNHVLSGKLLGIGGEDCWELTLKHDIRSQDSIHVKYVIRF